MYLYKQNCRQENAILLFGYSCDKVNFAKLANAF